MRQLPYEKEVQASISRVVKAYSERIETLEDVLNKVLLHVDLTDVNEPLMNEIKDVLKYARKL